MSGGLPSDPAAVLAVENSTHSDIAQTCIDPVIAVQFDPPEVRERAQAYVQSVLSLVARRREQAVQVKSPCRRRFSPGLWEGRQRTSFSWNRSVLKAGKPGQEFGNGPRTRVAMRLKNLLKDSLAGVLLGAAALSSPAFDRAPGHGSRSRRATQSGQRPEPRGDAHGACPAPSSRALPGMPRLNQLPRCVGVG